MSIKSELAACRAAFAVYEAEHGEPARYAHGLHHELAFEEITEPIENRITYILSAKPKKEQARRFANLRPVTAPAWAEYDKVTAPAWAEYDKVTAPALAEYKKVTAAAWAEYEKVTAAAWAEYEKVTAAAHPLACPIPDTCTWNGRSYL